MNPVSVISPSMDIRQHNEWLAQDYKAMMQLSIQIDNDIQAERECLEDMYELAEPKQCTCSNRLQCEFCYDSFCETLNYLKTLHGVN